MEFGSIIFPISIIIHQLTINIMPLCEIRVTEETTGIIISLRAAYERAKLMKVCAHTHDVAYKTSIQCVELKDKSKLASKAAS